MTYRKYSYPTDLEVNENWLLITFFDDDDDGLLRKMVNLKNIIYIDIDAGNIEFYFDNENYNFLIMFGSFYESRAFLKLITSVLFDYK